MRILVLGGTGMLGHKLTQVLSETDEAWTSVRCDAADLERFGFYDLGRVIGRVDAFDFATVENAIDLVQPDAVVNCIGMVKQQAQGQDPIACITLNALLPHQIAGACRARGARLIHISTDCVFSGRRGGYSESDLGDAEDVYGQTKQLGEVATPGSLTLRTSIIGRELESRQGLVEWFLSNAGGRVKGFRRAIFSGFTTEELSRIIHQVLHRHADLEGLYQVSSDPIDKFSLLCLVRDAFGVEVEIVPDEGLVIDRSLDSTRFRQATGYVPPSWEDMIRKLASEQGSRELSRGVA